MPHPQDTRSSSSSSSGTTQTMIHEVQAYEHDAPDAHELAAMKQKRHRRRRFYLEKGNFRQTDRIKYLQRKQTRAFRELAARGTSDKWKLEEVDDGDSDDYLSPKSRIIHAEAALEPTRSCSHEPVEVPLLDLLTTRRQGKTKSMYGFIRGCKSQG